MKRLWWFHWSTLASVAFFLACLAGVLTLFPEAWK